MASKSEQIREMVVDYFGNSDVQFQVRDVMSSLDVEGVTGSDDASGNSSLVATALRQWSENDSIVKGYRLVNLSQQGSTRRYQLAPIPQNGLASREDPNLHRDYEERSFAAIKEGIDRTRRNFTGSAQFGDIVTVEVLEVKPGGMLVRYKGKLYTMKTLDWNS